MKEPQIEEFRRAWFDLADGQQSPPGGCLKAEEVWRAAGGELERRRRREIVDHLAICPNCSEAWRLAVSLHADARSNPLAGEALETGLRWRVAAIAATLLLALGLPLGSLFFSQQEPGFRQQEEPVIQSLLIEQELIPRQRFVLRWTPVAAKEPVRYSVIVTTEDLQVVAEEQGLLETHYQVPQALLSHLKSGARLRWQIQAILDNGRQFSSATFSSRLE